MSTRKEITKKYAFEYKRGSKKTKRQMLDQLVATIGWSRANTRRALVAALAPTRKDLPLKGFSTTKPGSLLPNSITLGKDGGKFINHALINWASDRGIYFTRSRPYRSNDNAYVEGKNGDVVCWPCLPLPL